MVRERKSIDIRSNPELLRLALHVQETGEPCLLRDGETDVAEVVPLGGQRAMTQEDFDAFRSAAGSWSDVDTDKLLKDIYASRGMAPRPRVDL